MGRRKSPHSTHSTHSNQKATNMTKFTDIQATELLMQARHLILSDPDFNCAVDPRILAKQIEALAVTIISTNKGE
jgi:hypothetical protein